MRMDKDGSATLTVCWRTRPITCLPGLTCEITRDCINFVRERAVRACAFDQDNSRRAKTTTRSQDKRKII